MQEKRTAQQPVEQPVTAAPPGYHIPPNRLVKRTWLRALKYGHEVAWRTPLFCAAFRCRHREEPAAGVRVDGIHDVHRAICNPELRVLAAAIAVVALQTFGTGGPEGLVPRLPSRSRLLCTHDEWKQRKDHFHRSQQVRTGSHIRRLRSRPSPRSVEPG